MGFYDSIRMIRTYWKLFPNWIIFLILGIYLGLNFPDIDQRTHLLIHRSIFTHGLIVPLFFFLFSSRITKKSLRLFLMGFVVAIAVHLSFDLFPIGWKMHALIHIPQIGWTHKIVSISWIFISIVFCIYVGIALIREAFEGFIFSLIVIGTFVFESFGESRFFAPLIILIITNLVAIWWKLTTATLKIKIFRLMIRVLFLSLSTITKRFTDFYCMIRDEYNVSMQQKRSFPNFFVRVLWIWLVLFFSTIRDVMKIFNSAYEELKNE